jgi:hypothetical protein
MVDGEDGSSNPFVAFTSQPIGNNTLILLPIQAAFIHPLMTDEVDILFASAIMMFKDYMLWSGA